MWASHGEGARAGRLAGGVWAVALVLVGLLLATSGGYGYHRDEMYFIVAGGHPAFGYPDQPPLVPLLSAAMEGIAPGSLPVLRIPSALAAGTTALLSALIARELQGGRGAQITAAACTAVGAITLATGHYVTTTTFDVLSTTAFGWLLVRAVLRRRPQCLLWAGVVVGVGVEAKPQVAFVAAVLLGALAVLGPRWPFRSWWLGGGILAALALATPYVAWQAAHGWPQLTVTGNIAGSAEGGRVGFLAFQLVLVGPLLVPVWAAGLAWPWRSERARPLRFLSVGCGLIALAYLIGNGKAYYLASLYPTLLGLGGVPVAAWVTRRRWRRGLLVGTVSLSLAINALIALPLLPERKLQGSPVMALNPDQGETVGWPRLVDTVTRAWRSLPAEQRRATVILTGNYGEASALKLLGEGLPGVYSGHNAYGEWGPPPDGARAAVLVGFTRESAAEEFSDCTRLATVDNGVGLDNDEQGGPVLLCTPRAGWPTLWPRLTHLD